MLEIYTDGACKKNHVGSWGFILVKDDVEEARRCGVEGWTTNQRMELTAALRALESGLTFGREVTIVSDSAYLVNCFVKKWFEKWRKVGWKNSTGQAVKNQDLWEKLLEEVDNYPSPIHFRHIKGHAGHKWNEAADELAVSARNLMGR